MPAPELIGRYRLGRRLGAGGFAVVWLAYDETLDTTVAIKVMADNWAHRMDLRERFLTEARMLRRAASNRVVQVFDIGELPDGRPYFVMDFADLGTLEDRTLGGPLPLVEALRMTAEVALGAAELHHAGIVHRDLKPSNVLLRSAPNGQERVLVADLGVAKSLAQASGLTMSVGSAGYMAPEQAEPNFDVDVRADVYSLGALGYHLITGNVPGPPGRVLVTEPGQPELPVAVRKLLRQTLEPDRERRWPDATSLAQRLTELADELSAQRRRTLLPRRRTMVATVLVAAVVALAAGGVLEHRRPVTVHDASRRIEVAVPRPWARQLVASGWDPAALQLSGGRAPGLMVASNAGRWGDLRQGVDGVFVGLAGDPNLAQGVAGISHPECGQPSSTLNYHDARWNGSGRRWNNCLGSGRTLEEISLTGAGSTPVHAYLQIRQDSGSNATNQVLSSLRVTG